MQAFLTMSSRKRSLEMDTPQQPKTSKRSKQPSKSKSKKWTGKKKGSGKTKSTRKTNTGKNNDQFSTNDSKSRKKKPLSRSSSNDSSNSSSSSSSDSSSEEEKTSKKSLIKQTKALTKALLISTNAKNADMNNAPAASAEIPPRLTFSNFSLNNTTTTQHGSLSNSNSAQFETGELEILTNSLLQDSYHSSTMSKYQKNWHDFSRFSSLYNIKSPSKTEHVALYISHLHRIGYKVSTIHSILSGLSFRYKITNEPDPTKSFLINRLLIGAKKSESKVPQLKPIRKILLFSIVDNIRFTMKITCKQTLLKALFILAYSACLRIGE